MPILVFTGTIRNFADGKTRIRTILGKTYSLVRDKGRVSRARRIEVEVLIVDYETGPPYNLH